MGIATIFLPVSAATLAALLRDPDAAEAVLCPDDDSEVEGTFDVDKAWHGLHYLLTGTVDAGEAPIRWAILGDEDLGADLGMGGSTFLTPGQVREVATALAAFTEDGLRANFNPAEMARFDIYPGVIWERDGTEALDYLMEHFGPLQQFYADAAERGEAVVIYQG